MVIVPFISEKQTFTCQLGDFFFRFRTLFNDVTGVWHFDLYDAATDEPICYQIPIFIGHDLLEALNLGIGGMIATDMSAMGLDAGPDDLGTRVVVAYLTPAELELEP